MILYGEKKDDKVVSFLELGSGISTLAPLVSDANEQRETLRIPIHTRIISAAELPSESL